MKNVDETERIAIHILCQYSLNSIVISTNSFDGYLLLSNLLNLFKSAC